MDYLPEKDWIWNCTARDSNRSHALIYRDRSFLSSLNQLKPLWNVNERTNMAKEHRTFKEECSFIERLNKNSFLIKKGFVPNMKVSEREPNIGSEAQLQLSSVRIKIHVLRCNTWECPPPRLLCQDCFLFFFFVSISQFTNYSQTCLRWHRI